MDGRRPALFALLAFLGLTVVSLVVSGSRPGLQQGAAPAVVQFLGYACALAAAVLLLCLGVVVAVTLRLLRPSTSAGRASVDR